MFRLDRVGCKGGGISVYVRDCMQLFCEMLNMNLVLLRSMNLCS
jgi:hypothetical protein